MGSAEEQELKRRHMNNSSINENNSGNDVGHHPNKQPVPVSEDKKVDATLLQYQNHKLVQQLDAQKSEIRAIKEKFQELKKKQVSFDDTLMCVNRCWNELEEDLEFLSVCANAGRQRLSLLESLSAKKDRINPNCSPEAIFLHRLLETGATESSSTSNGNLSIEATLSVRKDACLKSTKYLLEAIDAQRSKNDKLFWALKNDLAASELLEISRRIDQDLQAEIHFLRSTMDAIHLKHTEIAVEVRTLQEGHSKDEAEIKRLRGELEETIADLETSRRKLATLRSQKDGLVGPPTPSSLSVLKDNSGEIKHATSFTETKEMNASVDDAKVPAAQILSEIQELHEAKLNLLTEYQRLQDLLRDEDQIFSSHLYMSLNEQFQHLNSEIERHRVQIDNLQTERDNAFRRESELAIKAETVDVTKKGIGLRDARITKLETQLQECMVDRDGLQLRLEEAQNLSRGRETVPELKVMITTLHKEMGLMQGQLDMYKETARSLWGLRADIQSDASVLERKTRECNTLADKVSKQLLELQHLKDQVKVLQESEHELRLILDMYESQCSESREVMQARYSECIAWGQVEKMKEALDEHSLELRVKAANEAEAACQQRLAVAESEIADLRQRLDASERMALELNENLKSKDDEGDAYVSEIETIGQAYEDMQMQNQRLLQQISERDDHNAKLVSDGVKAKQNQTTLISEKQIAEGRSQHALSVADSQKQIVAMLEEQVRTFTNQLSNAAEEAKKVSSSLDAVRRRTAEMENETGSVKSALKHVAKELKDQGARILEVRLEIEGEKFEKKRMQEDLAAVSRKTARHSVLNEGGTLIEKLQEEIKEYKAVLKCGICHDRSKEVVITKCYHLFCSPCIQRNLESRHRKCPSCGVPFGQNDVRNVYI